MQSDSHSIVLKKGMALKGNFSWFKRRTMLTCLSILIVIAVVLGGAYHFKLEALAWSLWQTKIKTGPSANSLNLNGYQVAVDGLAVDGLDEVSGLTYNLETNTLFTVLNKEPLLVELSLDGQVLRKVRIDGVEDMEGITHIKGNQYVIVDESDLRLILIELKEGINWIDATQASRISLGIDAPSNKNFEGVSWDGKNNRLLVVKERDPMRMLAVEGFIGANPAAPSDLSVSQVVGSDFATLKLRDFSSITNHDITGHPILLSDESRLAVEYTTEGNPVSVLALWKGFHGLKKNVPQAEGIAIGPDNRIYIVSEPNLFYVFKPESS